MVTQVKVPMLPESVADATVSTWHKKVGDHVNRDENLVDIETDKVMLEVPAPVSGVLKEILHPTGATVGAADVIAVIDVANESAAAKAPAEKPSAVKEEKPAAITKETKSAAATKETLSPSARRAVGELGVDANNITGSGKDGRITKQDVVSQTKAPAAPAVNLIQTMGDRAEQRVPMTRLRKKIAERLLASQQSAAILTTFNEVNLKAVSDIRKQYQEKFVEAHGIKLGFMSFFVKAAVEALKRFPVVNASIDGDDIVYHGYFDIGVAVSSDRGLVVPILRNVDQLNLAGIEKAIAELSTKARNNQLTVEDMTGGTFTISNGGTFGSLMSTPILNPPQSAILGMHKIEDRPVVVDGQIVIRPMMYLAMSYDHRIIDGRESVTFLRTIKELLEEPARLLLDI